MKKGPGKSPADKRPERSSGKEPTVQDARQAVEETLDAEKAKKIKEFLGYLRRGDVRNTAFTWWDSEEIDFAASEGFEEAMREGLLACIEKGNNQLSQAKKLLDFVEDQNIDIKNYEWYQETVKGAFMRCLIKVQTEKALAFFSAVEMWVSLTDEKDRKLAEKAILKTMDAGKIGVAMELAAILKIRINLKGERYRRGVKKGFALWVSNGRGDRLGSSDVREYMYRIAAGIDLTKETRATILSLIKEGRVNRAAEVWEETGKTARIRSCKDYEEAVRVGFLICLKDGHLEKACQMQEVFGNGINFDAEIREGFVHQIGKNKVKKAIAIREQFGVSIDWTHDPDYSNAMSNWFAEYGEHKMKSYPWIDGSAPPKKSPFADHGEITPELLFSFEGYLIYCARCFDHRTRQKLIELGSPTGDPTELSEDDQAKLQAFAVNLHTELSVKIRAIASPELIAAYLAQNTGAAGSEFLTNAA